MKQYRTDVRSPLPALDRRRVLGLIGTATAGSLAIPVYAQSGAADNAAQACVAVPRQTEGPYFVDEMLARSDIRHDPSDGSMRPGVPLHLTLRVSRISGNACTPLQGALVDVWQCDALGEYAGVRDPLYDNRGRKFLRGYQVLDENGEADFVTVYPGWYPGRTVHIHFKIRTRPGEARGEEFSSQLYFDDALTDRVHAQRQPYAGKGQRSTRNDNDRIYQRGGGQALMLALEEEGEGFAATFELGLQSA